MRVITATHNYEFLQGTLMAGEEAVDVYVFDRRSEGGIFTLVAEQWNHAAVILGFTEPGILSIYGRKSS